MRQAERRDPLRHFVVIGAGMAGLATASLLAQQGLKVSVLEARDSPGGLASSFEVDAFVFDAGPYILLDRPGLDWIFANLNGNLNDCLKLEPIDDIYEVETLAGFIVRFHSSLDQTAEEIDQQWPGAGKEYKNFVERMKAIHEKLRPLLFTPKPRPLDALRYGGIRSLKFLTGTLSTVLKQTELPLDVCRAISIWTHIAGQAVDEAPAPMAFLPALIHHTGAYYCAGGIAAIPRALFQLASSAGVQFVFGSEVRRIVLEGKKVKGVETIDSFFPADAVVSTCSGLKTYLQLVPELDSKFKSQLQKLPLQSPGICVYLTHAGAALPPYLRFRFLDHGGCVLFVQQSLVDRAAAKQERSLARLIAPLDYTQAESGKIDQQQLAHRLIEEWPFVSKLPDLQIHSVRTTSEWGNDFFLYKNSMNPVMTARLMRRGRLPHRSPHIAGLYLAGSSTHPGQWVSFAGISGIHAARTLLQDLQ